MKISDRVGEDLLDLHGALEVDFQNHVGALGDPLLDGLLGGAVAVAVHMGPFHEGVGPHHGVEFLLRDEKVLASVLLLAARRAGGVRDRGLHARVELQQRLDQAGFAGAAGGRNDKQISGIVHDSA